MKITKLRITKNKVLIVAIVVMLIILFFVLNICFIKEEHEKETFATIETLQEARIAEEPEGEFISINELDENIIDENAIDENVVQDKNIEQNEDSNKKINNVTPYYIKVNYGAQVVNIYSKDESGNYTIPVKAMVCSTGIATPKSGVYSIPARWNWLGLQGDVYGQYCTQIKGNILFHSVPYLRRGDQASLEYWEYDKLGTYASLGCIRLTVKDAKWIYDNCARGTQVEFYSSIEPGPLGKPSATKISSYPDYLRNWDPTDPSPNNPWNTYQEPEKNNNIKNEQTNSNVNEQASNETSDKNTVENNKTNNVVSDKANNIETNNTNNVVNDKNNNVENNKTNNVVSYKNTVENNKTNNVVSDENNNVENNKTNNVVSDKNNNEENNKSNNVVSNKNNSVVNNKSSNKNTNEVKSI